MKAKALIHQNILISQSPSETTRAQQMRTLIAIPNVKVKGASVREWGLETEDS